MTNTDFLLALENVSVSFDGFKAVNALNLYIDKGELRVIIGPNGAGKTTVLDLICGRTRVSEGSIKFKNQEITAYKEQQIVRLGIGRKFQTPTIYEDLTVFENLELSMPVGRDVIGALFWNRTEQVKQRVHEVAEMIFLKDQLDRFAQTLSHGQKQWLEIGMLLIQDPELLMLDEPVAGMSVSERVKTAELLNEIIKNRSVIVIEHDMKFVESIAHRVTVLHQGKVLAEGDMQTVQANPRGQRGLPRSLRESSMFDVRKLTAAYGQSEVLHGIDLSVGAGEIVALVGRNGMGKSTLMKSMIGVMPLRSGSDHRRWRRCHENAQPQARGQRARVCSAGPPDFRYDDGQGKYRDRTGRYRQERHPERNLRPVPDPEGLRTAARRQPFRRPAATAGDCARARERAEGASARRADRGDPALDHQGYRAVAS